VRNPKKFIATFPAGCYEIVARKLKEFSLNELEILTHDDSSVTFWTSFTPEKLIEIRFFTNVYMILNPDKLTDCKPLLKGRGFSLTESISGQPSMMDTSERNGLIRIVTKQLGLKPYFPEQSNHFILMRRGSADKTLTFKLSRAKHKREELPAGALRPELANILLLVSGVKAKNNLLDPFGGHGSILLEAMRGFGVKASLAIEKDSNLVTYLESRGVDVIEGNAKDLSGYDPESIDKVVTDPPWGIYKDANELELANLYSKFLSEVHRVLKPEGVLVILSGSSILDDIISDLQDFKLLKSYKILVSGKKATIFKLQKA
jgi:16S rRNA G966 N2-methylase RsmD